MTRAMGVDLGSARTGVAVAVAGIAQPLTVLTAKDGELVDALASLAREQDATEIVVGDPIRLDGTVGPAAERARATAERLRGSTSVPVVMWDERLTTAEAERTLIEADVRRKRRRSVVDTMAATLMLQSYLDAHRVPR